MDGTEGALDGCEEVDDWTRREAGSYPHASDWQRAAGESPIQALFRRQGPSTRVSTGVHGAALDAGVDRKDEGVMDRTVWGAQEGYSCQRGTKVTGSKQEEMQSGSRRYYQTLPL